MDPISSNSERPFLPVSSTRLVNETMKTASVEDPKYTISEYDIVHNSSIFSYFLSSILLLIIQFLLDLRQLGTLQHIRQESKPCIYNQPI